MAKRKPQHNYRVWFWHADTTGCGFDRCFVPSDALNNLKGWHSQCGMFVTPNDLIAQRIDLLVGQRVSTPNALPLWRAMIHPDAPATIYEVDDLLFHVEPTNRGSYEFYSQAQVQNDMASAIWLADALTVSCVPLANELRSINPNVFVIPNFLPKSFLTTPKQRDTNELPIIGWAGGSSHLEDMRTIVPALRTLAETQDFVFRNYGQNYTDLVGLPKTEHVPWQMNKADYMAQLDLDIGLCPLRDSRFNQSKTAVKALEYALKGIPTVASNVTPYKEFVKHGETGFLCSTKDDWVKYLTLLVEDEDLRFKLGTNAYEFAKTQTIERNINYRAQVFANVIEHKHDVRRPKYEQIAQAQRQNKQLLLPDVGFSKTTVTNS